MNKWANDLNTQFSAEVQMANKYMRKRFQHGLAI
jgi:hypothetical protein